MRRKDREVSNLEDIIAIMKKCDVCRLALFDKEYPYIVPLNFGVSRNKDRIDLYFHGAGAGKKLELIHNNKMAAFEMDCSHNLIIDEGACRYTMEYESVCGNGIVEILKENEKYTALNHLMKQYAPDKEFHFSDNQVNTVTVFKLKVTNITGKRLLN